MKAILVQLKVKESEKTKFSVVVSYTLINLIFSSKQSTLSVTTHVIYTIIKSIFKSKNTK